MSQKYVIDNLLPQIKEVDTKNIADNFTASFVTINIKYGETVIPTIVLRNNIFDDELAALKAYQGQLNKELLAVQYKINSMDKKEE